MDDEGNKSTYHIILEIIWKIIRNNQIYIIPSVFNSLNIPTNELDSYLSRLIKNQILEPIYRIDCPECDAPYEEINCDPLSIWGKVYECPLCNNTNQVLLEDILFLYKFNTSFREPFHSFFFLQNYRNKNILERAQLV